MKYNGGKIELVLLYMPLNFLRILRPYQILSCMYLLKIFKNMRYYIAVSSVLSKTSILKIMSSLLWKISKYYAKAIIIKTIKYIDW